MLTGHIHWFSKVKNFGFITPNSGGKEVFFYATEFEGDASSLKPQMWVSYEAIDTPRGPRALRVELCKKRGEHERSSERELGKVVSFGTD